MAGTNSGQKPGIGAKPPRFNPDCYLPTLFREGKEARKAIDNPAAEARAISHQRSKEPIGSGGFMKAAQDLSSRKMKRNHIRNEWSDIDPEPDEPEEINYCLQQILIPIPDCNKPISLPQTPKVTLGSVCGKERVCTSRPALGWPIEKFRSATA